jgi:SOS response regulatory protein OraA/RecX
MKELNYTKQRVIQRLTERGFNYKQIEDWLNENFSYWNITGTEGSD